MANQFPSATSLKLWFGWVVANTIGGAISAGLVLNELLKSPGSDSSLFLSVAAFSLSISLCQGVFLSSKISKVLEWIVGSFLSILCSPLVSYFISVSFLGNDFLLTVCLTGFGIGLAQWFFALRKIPQSALWIVFSSFGWGVGLVGGLAMLSIVYSLGSVIAGATATFLYGAITGIVLVQLLQGDAQRNSSN
jgi:hypothetical protein